MPSWENQSVSVSEHCDAVPSAVSAAAMTAATVCSIVIRQWQSRLSALSLFLQLEKIHVQFTDIRVQKEKT